MTHSTELSDCDLAVLREIVTDEVSSALIAGRAMGDLRERLRVYERTATEVDLGPQTLQVIRSGRRLLGDTKRPRSRVSEMRPLQLVRSEDGSYTVCRGKTPLIFDVPAALAAQLADRWSLRAVGPGSWGHPGDEQL